VAYLLAGGLSAMVYSASLLLVALVVLPMAAVGNTLLLLPFLFFLAMGLAGISAALAAVASTHGEYFFAYQQVVQILLLTLSTVYYPIEIIQNYLPTFLTSLVSANPLSLAAQAMRNTFLGNAVQPFSLLNILLASLPFTVIGAVAYLFALRTIQAKGKM
jgi:ABC-type polysaccharide/polyol phosphate export permease